ncbi:helix-turn-helix domain-containing protein [bacterium]|nr:helix-turn-helix domain-containing protein [bacterium]
MSKYLSIEEAAELLAISGDDVTEWICSGVVNAVRRGGDMMIPQHDFQDLLKHLPPEYEQLKARYAQTRSNEVRPRRKPERQNDIMDARGQSKPMASPLRRVDSFSRQRSAAPNPGGFRSFDSEEIEDIDHTILPSSSELRADTGILPAASAKRGRRDFAADGLESTLERLIEPIVRTQSRIISTVSELKNSSRAGFDEKQLISSIEASIDARLSKLNLAAESSGSADTAGLAALNERFESALQALDERLAGLASSAQSGGEPGSSEEFERLQKRYSQLKNEYEQLSDELDGVRASSRERTEQIEKAAKDDIARSREELQQARLDLDKAREEEKQAQAKLGEAEDRIAELEKSKEELNSDISALQQECDSLRQAALDEKNRFAEASQATATLETEKSGLQERVEKLRQQLDEMPSLDPLEELRATMDANGLEGDELVQKTADFIKSQQQKLGELKDKYETCEEENSSLYLLIDGLQKETSSLKKAQTDGESRYMSLEQAHSALKDKHFALDKEHAALKKEHSELEGEHASLKETHEQEHTELLSVQRELEAAQQVLQDRELPAD